jgi:nucleoid-associated protein YgaU
VRGYLYKGRHRKPSTTGRNAARVAVVGAAVLGPAATAAGAASADTLDSIEKCESSGNLRASNGTHFGLYQFDLATWRSVGGSGNPMDASRAEQRSRAEALLAQRGTGPWTASQHCWGGHAHAVSGHASAHPAPKHRKPAVEAVTAPAPAPRAHHPHHRPSARQRPAQAVTQATDTVTVRTGDTLSQIAAQHHESWRTLWAHNRRVVGDNPNLILPGQKLST